VADYATPFASALSRCRNVRTLQAELGLSGQVGTRRLRGRVLAGLIPGALRLEGVAPFGSPVFILIADGSSGTLLLLRDRRVLQDAPPEEILNALVGIRLGPDDLRAALSGCVNASAEPAGGRAYGPDWIAVDLAAQGTIYLQRQDDGWRIVAGRYAGLDIEYTRFAGDLPAQIQIRGAGLSLALGLSQVEANGELQREPLVAAKIPPGLLPITLQELRDTGPLGTRD
jgi:hypothetical protein